MSWNEIIMYKFSKKNFRYSTTPAKCMKFAVPNT